MPVEHKNYFDCLLQAGDAGLQLITGFGVDEVQQAFDEFKDAIQSAIDDGKQSRLSDFDQSSTPETSTTGAAVQADQGYEKNDDLKSLRRDQLQDEIESLQRDAAVTGEAPAPPPQQEQQQQMSM